MRFPTDGYLMAVFLKTAMEDCMSFDQWKKYAKPQKNLPLCDAWLELAWQALGDVPTRDDKNNDAWELDEKFETPWARWEKGTCVMDVWRWFDAKHSKGVAYLMFGKEPEKEDEE